MLEKFCLGWSASKAARECRWAKNTVLSHHGEFRKSMEGHVADCLAIGGIATNPVTLGELESLEKALRKGSRIRRERACRHLFLHSLTFEERLEVIFRARIVPEIQRRVKDAVERLETGHRFVDIRYAQSSGRRAKIAPVPFREAIRRRWTAFWIECRARLDPVSHILPKPAEGSGANGFRHREKPAKSGRPAAMAIALETEPNRVAGGLCVESQPTKPVMNITDLLRLKEDQLLPLIRQVAERVRSSRTPRKYQGLKAKLLEACDLVLPVERTGSSAEGGHR